MYRLRVPLGLVVTAAGAAGAVWLWRLAAADEWPGEIAGMIAIMGLVVVLLGLGLVAFDR